MFKNPYLVFCIKGSAGFKARRVQSTLVVLQSLGTRRKVKGGGQDQKWTKSDKQRPSGGLRGTLMDRVFLTNRFSISLTSSLTWLRILLQHSALCWILSFSVGSSGERQTTQSGGKCSFHSGAQITSGEVSIVKMFLLVYIRLVYTNRWNRWNGSDEQSY